MKMKRMFAAAVALVLFCTGLAFAQEETQEDDWYLETRQRIGAVRGRTGGRRGVHADDDQQSF